MNNQEAIKSLKNIIEYWTYKPTEVEAAKLGIEALEKQTTNGWVSVKERLPEIRKDCLVTVRYSGFMGMHGFWIKTGHLENDGSWWGDCCGGEILAWQLLPEPYTEVSNDN